MRYGFGLLIEKVAGLDNFDLDALEREFVTLSVDASPQVLE